jgi:hypothetical protein
MVITCGATAQRSALASLDHYDCCNRISVLYFPFSEATVDVFIELPLLNKA